MRIHKVALAAAVALLGTTMVRAEGNLKKVKHIIIVMQENHSFDNYFGALAYAPNSPYHNADRDADRDRDDRGCRKDDHRCVDGLSCIKDHWAISPASIPTLMTMATPSWRSMIRDGA